jgi:ectoine hydroxylase-related dioxygenase (phytanoyl-CoA dioxygenase family)
VDDVLAGGTHFPKLNHTFTSYGGVLVFDGTIEHAGLGNRSKKNRYFLYAAIYTGKDKNCD